MAVTQNSYEGDGSTTNYSFTFPYLKKSEIKASLDATVTTAFTTPTATTVQFNTAPASGAKIKIYRETDSDSLTATFYAGSAIKSEDLNDNFTQNLYATQEINARYLSNLGGIMVGDLQLGEDVAIKFEGATDNDYETTLTVANPTADRTITLPNVTGTVITTGDTGTVATSMIAGDAVNGDKIADNAINSEHYTDGSIDTVHIADANITTAKLATDAVTTDKITDANVTTAKIADANVTTAKIAADAITGAKIADDSIDSEHYVDGSIDTAHIADSQITSAKIADGTIVAADLASNAVTTVKITDANVTTAKIADSNITTSKLVDNAVTTAKVTDANITTAKLADNAVTTAKITDANVTTAKIADDNVTTAKIADDNVTTAKIPDNAITTDKIADAELTTLAGMPSGTASILADTTALTATTAELNILDNKSFRASGDGALTTTSDTEIPSSKVIANHVAAQLGTVGGFTTIATEVAFPATASQPAAGIIISISDAAGIVVNGSGVSTTGRTTDGTPATVTINSFPSSLNGETLASGVGLLVTSTGSGNTYTYHKILAAESDVKQLSDDINDFNARYRVAGSAPGSNNDAGDMYFDTSANKMKVYNGTTSTWDDVASVGNFYINTISSSSSTGGGSATFNGSAYRFTLSNPPTSAQQLIVSVNGVIQKPDAGSSQPSEGFAISGNDIIFSAAPASGSDYFIITQGSSVSIGTPSDNTVSTAKIQNQAVTTAKITDANVTNAKIADDTIAEGKLDVHNAPATGKYLKYTSNGMEWADGASEGTDVKSTGESGGTKFLREDGDGTSSWQAVPTDSSKANLSGATFTGTVTAPTITVDNGTSSKVSINSSTHNASVANEAKLELGFAHSGNPDAIGYVKLNESGNNAFDGKLTVGVPYNGGSGGSATRDALFIQYNGAIGVTGENYGTSGQVLTSGGSGAAPSWTTISAAPEVTGTTDGAVTAGDPIIATSEGKLAKVVAYTKTAGTPGVANDSYRGNIQVAYDKISGKVAAAFRESSKITIKVGTISGTTVTWGSKQDVTTDATDPFAVGFHNNVLLVGYRNSGAKARVATVSGTTISTFGSEASISTSGNPYMRNCFYSEVSERWVLQWHNASNYPNYTQLVVGTISGTTFSFGSIQDCFDSNGVVDRPGIREMTSVGKIIVFGIQDMHPEHRFQTRVGTIDTSDNSVDWETQQEYEWFGTEGGNDNEFDYYGTEQDCDLAWHDDGKYAIAVARKGTSSASEQKPYALKLSYNESTKVFSYNRDNVLLLQDELVSNCMNAIYVPDTKEIMAWWVDRSTSDGQGWIRWKTIKSSGEYTLQFVDPVSSSTNGNQVGANDDTSGGPDHTGQNSVYAGAGRVIFGYRDNSQSNKTYTAIQQFATTNAASQEFIGFASSSVGDNASLTVKVTGNTLTTSNLTAGKKHYVQNNGSLSTSPDTPSIEAGIALSSTKLLIKG